MDPKNNLVAPAPGAKAQPAVQPAVQPAAELAPGPKALTAADLLGAPIGAPTPVDLPELGGRAYVREMTAAERDQFDEELRDESGKLRDGYRARLVAATACDADGKLLFRPEQAQELATRGAALVVKLARVAARVNALTAEAVEDAKKG